MKKIKSMLALLLVCLFTLPPIRGKSRGKSISEEREVSLESTEAGIKLAINLELDDLMDTPLVKDITPTHFAYEGAQYFRDQIAGVDWIEDKPLNRLITKGEFITMLTRFSKTIANATSLTNEGIDASYRPPFVDWDEMKLEHQGALAHFYDAGFLEGSLVDGELWCFGNEYITREDMLVIVGRYDDIRLEETTNRPFDSSYTDENQMASYAKSYIYYYSDLNMVSGYPTGAFKPQAPLLMGEAIKFLYTHAMLMADTDEVVIIYENTNTTIYAGNRQIGYIDDRLLNASFAQPMGMTLYGNNILVADSGSHLIREISPIRVKTILGQKTPLDITGMPQGAYVDGRKTAAYLHAPAFIQGTGNGDFIFTDNTSHMVRKYIKAYDIVVTVAGKDYSGNHVGAEKDVLFDSPSGLAIDKENNLYVADTLNHQIKKIDTNGKTTIFAGTGHKGQENGAALEATFREPTDIFYVDQALYVLDGGNSLLRKIEGGQVSTIAGKITPLDEETNNLVGGYIDGNSHEAAFRNPQGLYVVSDNEIYIADTYNHAIRKVSNGQVSSMAGGSSFNRIGKADEAGFHEPRGIVCIQGQIYVSDTNNHVIKLIKTSK